MIESCEVFGCDCCKRGWCGTCSAAALAHTQNRWLTHLKACFHHLLNLHCQLADVLCALALRLCPASQAVLVIFSIWCQQACGLSCGVVPFVSKRSTGLVYGLVGAGGNTGAAVVQASEFKISNYKNFTFRK